MKINVLTLDKQIISLDVHPDEPVENVRALLNVEKEELLYEGKEMSNGDKLSELGVRDGDMVVIVSNSDAISRLSPNELDPNPDGPALNSAAVPLEIRHDINQCKPDLEENAVRVDEGVVSRPFSADNGISSELLDEESYSEQESVWGSTDMNEKVNVETNATSTHAEDFDGDRVHIPNSSDKVLSNTSIREVGSGVLTDSKHFTSIENVNADMLLSKHSKEPKFGNSEPLDSALYPCMASPHCENPPPITTKGYGLKKWRRIRREFAKDASPSLDSTKMLKRGSANILDTKQPNDSSVSSTNALMKSPGLVDQFSHPIQISNHILAVDATFSAGADDSDDRSSKSSTAASAPKHRHGLLSASGHHQREKLKVKNVSGRQLNSSGQRFQIGKGPSLAETSKKARGDTINVDKENSLSSIECDSRSYGSVLVKGTGSVESDHLQSEKSANFDGEDSYDQACEVQSAEELQAGHIRNGDLSPDFASELSSSNNGGKSKDQLSRECEPLVNSILMLQSAQEALEKEVHLFKELGKGIHSLCDDSGKTTVGSTYAMFTTPEACADHCSDSQGSESNHVSRKNVHTLERQLDEAKVRLREKDLRVAELEMVMNSMELPQVDVRSAMELQQKRCREMEAELEVLFKQNVEAEVQYVVMTKSTEDWSVLVEDQSKLLREHDSKARKQAQLLRVVANKTAVLQGQHKLDSSSIDIVEEEIPKVQKRIVKFTSCLLIQLSLLTLVFRLLMLQLSPKSATVVPT